jgi:hypothetical protein
MAQLLYAVSALAIVMIFSLGMQRAGITGQQEMMITEARTRMLGVARETVERVSRMDMPFDAATDLTRGASEKVFPYVTSAGELTAPGSFGGCVGYINDCLDIDDFHNFSISDTLNGIPVTLEFEVSYVDALTGAESASATFAKQLRVKVSTISIAQLDGPLTVTYSRVFAYPSTTDFAKGVKTRS